MINRVELKKRAKEFAYSHKMDIWRPTLIIFCINFVISFVTTLLGVKADSELSSLITSLTTLLLIPIQVGSLSYIMGIIDGKTVDLKECMLSKFKDGSWWKILLASLCLGLIVGFWMVFLIVPGIYFALKYSMAQMIMADEKFGDNKILYALGKSSEMMDGHKWEYFVFILSFFGWFMLCPFTFGILYIWIYPYFVVANYYYFKELKKIAR